mmetsp:Transcript_62135/g.183653  ORF Transcript_62135/g.183653 Transcript_62135/m.183653 type:complete len:195 (+) Transcript_62135:148-732(+)
MMIRVVSSILLVACFALNSRALKFIPEFDDEEEGRRLGGNKKRYGYIQDEDCRLCIEVKKGEAKSGAKLWWTGCETGKKSQLWRFDRMTGMNGIDLRGKIHSKLNDRKCIQANKKFKPNSKVTLERCNSEKDHQKFLFIEADDSIKPRDAKDLRLYSSGKRWVKTGEAVAITDRDDYDSIDFGDDSKDHLKGCY